MTAQPVIMTSSAGSSQQSIELLAFLAAHDLQRYHDLLAANEVDMQTLPLLSDQDLESMGIVALGPRRKLMHAVRHLTAPGDERLSALVQAVDRMSGEVAALTQHLQALGPMLQHISHFCRMQVQRQQLQSYSAGAGAGTGPPGSPAGAQPQSAAEYSYLRTAYHQHYQQQQQQQHQQHQQQQHQQQYQQHQQQQHQQHQQQQQQPPRDAPRQEVGHRSSAGPSPGQSSPSNPLSPPMSPPSRPRRKSSNAAKWRVDPTSLLPIPQLAEDPK
eukprot:TRINITY_DN1984_c0_g5_i3.p1 TRINITY_DN1984_c0_g5~~TRINITY_DN1984_c0_g5_i3.p1  ORF type:complete len:306 (+),score=48.82 TRINITY_DN1984_c0_g5_i3:104-919(+)